MYDRKTAMSIAAALFIMLYISYCYFLQNPYNWNSVPRIALALSVIENGTLDITEYKPATGDIAIYKGKLYSDKAPGMSFMAIPFIAVTPAASKAPNVLRLICATVIPAASRAK